LRIHAFGEANFGKEPRSYFAFVMKPGSVANFSEGTGNHLTHSAFKKIIRSL
jgi:hypothetical protein